MMLIKMVESHAESCCDVTGELGDVDEDDVGGANGDQHHHEDGGVERIAGKMKNFRDKMTAMGLLEKQKDANPGPEAESEELFSNDDTSDECDDDSAYGACAEDDEPEP